MKLSPKGGLLLCQSANKTAELFCIYDEQNIARRRRRRISRQKKKGEKGDKATEKDKKEEDEEMEEEEGKEGQEYEDTAITDEIGPAYKLKTSFKIASCDFSPIKPQILFALSNNGLELYDVEEKDAKESLKVLIPGHRSDVRSITLSNDDSLLLSTSQGTFPFLHLPFPFPLHPFPFLHLPSPSVPLPFPFLCFAYLASLSFPNA